MLPIIICDDDSFTLQTVSALVKQSIEHCGKTAKIVCLAASGRELLAFIQKNPGTYLYFLDFDLGNQELNGIDLVRRIYQTDPGGKIVFVTSHTDKGMDILKSGIQAFGFIEKSLDRPKMIREFTRCLTLAAPPKNDENPTSFIEIPFLFSAFFFPQRLFNSASVLLGHLWLFWLIFCVYYTAVKLSLHSLRGNQFSCYLSFVILSVSAYGFFLVNYFAVPYLQKAVGSYALGLIGTTGLYSLLLLGAILFFRPRFFKPIEQLIQLGKKYPAIEPYYFLFSSLILVFCTVIFLPFSILSFQNPLVFLLFPALCILFLFLQFLFVRLLFRIAFYKDYASFNQMEKESLSSYYQNLNGTLCAMQNIRHDIKNIFFTMGNFVNESENQEMKDFFWGKIFPCSQDTIRQSELLSSICQLPSEPL